MSQTYTQRRTESGARAEMPRVTVENCGNTVLHWECQNYVPNKDLEITLEPGEKDMFDYDYARRVFGDWEVDPSESPERRIEWNGMIAHIKRKSPSMDGKLPNVKVYDHKGELLWDASEQMAEWLKYNSKSKAAFAPPKPMPGMSFEMPKVLEEASYDELKELWLKAFGSSMPHKTSGDVARLAIMPHLTADQIGDVIAELNAGPAPDMSQYTG